MSILDIATKVLTVYQADTSDMKSKVRELAGEQKRLAEAELAAAEARNKQAEGWIGKLGQVGLAMGALSGIARAAFEGLQQYGHRLDLEATAGAVSIDKLSAAAGGLKSRMELLEHAAVFNKSAFKLTEDQMGTVERAMWALEERGKSSEEVWGAVSTALTKGTTKALEGLIGPINKSSDAFDVNGDALMTYGARAKAVDAMLKQMAKTSGEVGEGQYDEADRIQKITVSITDSMDKMKESLGKMVVALEPLIISVAKLGEVAGDTLGQAVAGWRDIIDMGSFLMPFEERQRRILERHGMDTSTNAQGRYENYIAGGGSQGDFIASMIAMGERDRQYAPAPLPDYNAGFFHRQGDSADQVELQSAEWASEVKKMNAERMKMLREQWKKFVEADNEWREREADMWADKLQAQYDREAGELSSKATSAALRGSMPQQAPDVSALLAQFNRGELQKRIGEQYTQFQGEQNKTFLESVMGPLEQFNAYKGAWDSLSTAVLAGFDAWIDGSGGVAEAIRKALGSTMKSEALNMAAQALKATAFGIFSLATGDAPHAAAYFTSAAEFGAAALAFGLGAAALGGGGGGAGQSRASAPSAPSVVPSGGSSGPSGSIIVIGDSFAEDTPRQRQLRAQRMVSAALGSNSIVYG